MKKIVLYMVAHSDEENAIQCPNVLGLVAIFWPDKSCPNRPPVMFFDLMDGGSLDKYVKKQGNMTVKECVELMIPIANGLKHLHKINIVHGDMAARNILIQSHGHDKILKIADFGKAAVGRLNEGYAYDTEAIYDLDREAMNPWRWMPVELYDSGNMNSKSDIWAFGVTCWEILTKSKLPYAGIPGYANLVKQGMRLHMPEGCPNALFFLLLRCWLADQKLRPDAKNLHSAFAKFQNDYATFGILEDEQLSGELSEKISMVEHAEPFENYTYTDAKKRFIKESYLRLPYSKDKGDSKDAVFVEILNENSVKYGDETYLFFVRQIVETVDGRGALVKNFSMAEGEYEG